MRNRYIYIIGTRVVIALLALCCWQGCTSSDATIDREDPQPPVVNNGRVAVDLALSVSTTAGNSSATTRMAATTVQASEEDYRGIQSLRAYALNGEETVLGLFTNLHREPTDKSTHHYFAEDIDLSIGTKSFLCYAQAIPGDESTYSTNGAINATFDNTDLSKISFKPIAIADPDAETTDDATKSQISAGYATAATMAEYLTDIVTASSADEWINSTLYKSIVPSTTGSHIAGSSANLKALITGLYNGLGESPSGEKLNVKKAIKWDEIDTKLSISNPYPARIGLPDGSAALEWDGSKFVAVTTFVSNTPLSDHRRFVYPPELYYFIKSNIRISSTSRKDDYSKTNWNAVLETYDELEKDGDDNPVYPVVTSSTRSVAVEQALDYAVGCLDVSIKAVSNQLEDNEGKIITLTDDMFTLTGIMLGGQYEQTYLFEPTENTSAREMIIYDHEIPAGITLTTSWSETPVYTLAFQSRDGKPVDIVLEFKNNGAEFTGLGGVVHHDTKFYLVGQIWPENDDPSKTDDFYKRVFTKDYKSVVKLTIQSLKNAYNVIPELKTAAYSIKVDNVAITPWSDGGSQNHELYNW